MPNGQFHQRGRGRGRGRARASTPRRTTPAPPPPPPPPPPQLQAPPPQQAPDPEQDGDEDDEEGNPRKRQRGEDEDDFEDEEWSAAMWLLDPRASVSTMAANGNKHLYDEIRNITRLCGGHQANYANILSLGIKYHAIDKSDPRHPYWESVDYDSIAEAYMLFPVFLQYFPDLYENLDYIASHKLLVQKFAQFCEKVAVKSRGDDIGRIKLHIVAIAEFKDKRLERKANRGMNHLETAERLVPPRLLAELRADPEGFFERVRTKDIEIFSSDWPSMMYDMDLYRPGEHKPGFLRGRFLRNMLLMIYTGFSSTDVAEPGLYSGQGQPSVAKKHGLTAITIHSVVYIATLARFALTSYGKWSDMDGVTWNCRDFMKLILDFAHQNADWADETTAYWNKEIFGSGDEEDEATRAKRQKSSYYQAMASECTGRRRPPSSRDLTQEPFEPQEPADQEANTD